MLMIDTNDLTGFEYPELKKPPVLPRNVLTVRQLYRRQNGKCFFCFGELDPAPHRPNVLNGWTRDHFYPETAGNPLEGNMVLSCYRCNQSKGHCPPTAKEVKRYKALYLASSLPCLFGKGACK